MITDSPARERQTERRQARPALFLFMVVGALALAGWLFVLREGSRVPLRAASIAGLDLELDRARWILDQMDHGDNFQKPSSMMPDMPEFGKQRVTLELNLENSSQSPIEFEGSEFFLVPERGDAVSPMGAMTGHAVLGPGQQLNTAIHFDFDTTQPYGRLWVEWRHAGEIAYLSIPEPAEHFHLTPRASAQALPPLAKMVSPLGDAEHGRELYAGEYGCIACHGDLEEPGSNNVGPHLAGLATTAASRVEGMEAEQYVYESIIDPGRFLAPLCSNDLPCEAPTAMPEYASLMSLQDIADLLVYLTRS